MELLSIVARLLHSLGIGVTSVSPLKRSLFLGGVPPPLRVFLCSSVSLFFVKELFLLTGVVVDNFPMRALL